MQDTVHEAYSHYFERNMFKGYGEAGYTACMNFMNRNKNGYTDGDLEYFLTEPDDRTWDDREKILPVPIYKDTTDQYTDEECDDDNCVEIPVPEDLLWQWYLECEEFDREQSCQEPEGGWAESTIEDMYRWVWEESTCDETLDLYYWLTKHNYFWKRID